MYSVLIVEDEFVAAEYLKQVLEANDFNVLDIVDSGEEAIQKANILKPDIVLMDVMLQGQMSGCEAAVLIAKKIPCSIIFLSAYLDNEMVEYALEANAKGYLTKPYNEAQIIATLRLVTQEKKATKSLHVQEGTLLLADGYTYKNGKVFKQNKQVKLGPKTLKLFSLLCKTPNASISDEQICMHIWGEEVDGRTLRSLIFRIRSLVGENVIKNISGSGYMVCSRELT